MTRENVADKANRYLLEHRLTVLKVCGAQVLATCRGDGAVYSMSVDERRRWHCTCPSSGRCAHLIALGAIVAPGVNR